VGETNRIRIDKLQYRFPVGEDLNVWISGAKITLDDLADPLTPFTNSFTDGAVSFYGSIALIYLPNDNNGPGLGAAYNFTEDLSLAAFYSTGNGSLTESSNGLFRAC
jgi:hypothetical protein